MIARVEAYRNFTPHNPGLEKDGLAVGVTWSGDRATGYDLKPAEVRARLSSTLGSCGLSR